MAGYPAAKCCCGGLIINNCNELIAFWDSHTEAHVDVLMKNGTCSVPGECNASRSGSFILDHGNLANASCRLFTVGGTFGALNFYPADPACGLGSDQAIYRLTLDLFCDSTSFTIALVGDSGPGCASRATRTLSFPQPASVITSGILTNLGVGGVCVLDGDVPYELVV